MRARHIVILLNPAAGKASGTQQARIAANRLRERGLIVTEVAGGSAEESLNLALRSIAEGADGLVACGGDGTVHLALQATAGTAIPLGILPAGTANDNARVLGLPAKNLAKCADIIAIGHTRTIDVGHISTADGHSRYFLGVASMGFDSAATECANNMTWIKGSAKYLVAALATLRMFEPLPFAMTIDGRLTEASAMLAAVGNGANYGGGMKVCPDAKVDDAQLDMTVVGAVSKLRFLMSLGRVFNGSHVKESFVDQHRFKSATVDAPGQTVYADGEYVGPVPATFEVRPGALNVYADIN
jgi:diacylglycerol kinase (ATP)